ncbi:protein-tyrosine-phosphatase [Alienimonas chondri]|uniref:Protein ArsC n=1 Tax=Alienimonas chondri TaxID=2681879 RepID=A0ABX1VIP7_9PLAN|nr:protein-tyrosine-phosphatase [Alienimonas chondri]NNJ27679.1 Protein ArsC [Alienimonas chondri]
MPSFALLALTIFAGAAPLESPAMLPELQTYVLARTEEFDQIPAARKAELERLTRYVAEKRAAGEPVRLTFICTHNSRRSHLGQLWAAVAATHYRVSGVETFSGGTEATAFNPRAVAALQRAGVQIESDDAETNPRYTATYSDSTPAAVHFSKKYDTPPNPTADFAAIMVCTDADEACPVVAGAAFRLALPYEDPKVADDTPQEATRYDERTAQIGRELLYAFSKVRLVKP